MLVFFMFRFFSYVDVYDLPDPCDDVDIVLRYIACKMQYKTGSKFYHIALFVKYAYISYIQ